MATAALRGLLVVAALALGFFVLSKAFTSGGGTPTTTPGGVPASLSPSVSPSVVESPTRAVPEPLDPSEIKVQVLNGTETAGLAADTAEILEQAEYDIVTVDDAESAYDTTTVFYVPKRRIDAQVLRDAFFPTAVLEVAEEDSKVDITVILGTDYLESAGTGPGETPEETPT
ncbi:MAG: LytR C-terminal domain-containing protein [Actinomycetota bacterium]